LAASLSLGYNYRMGSATPRRKRVLRALIADRQLALSVLIVMIGLILLLIQVVIFRPEAFFATSYTLTYSFLMVTSGCFCMVGLAGIYSHRLTDWHLKLMDLVWMIATAMGLIFAMTFALSFHSEQLRSEVRNQLLSYRPLLVKGMELLSGRLCNPPHPNEQRMCDALGLAEAQTSSVLAAPDQEQTAVICSYNPPDREDGIVISKTVASLCLALAAVHKLQSHQSIRDSSSSYLLRGIFPYWLYLLAFALGIRLSKSVIDIGWLKIGSKALPSTQVISTPP
jgi:hypothetical protein